MSLQIHSAGEIKYPPVFYHQSLPFKAKKGMSFSLAPGSVFKVKNANENGVSFEALTISKTLENGNLKPTEQSLLKYDGKKLIPCILEGAENSVGYKKWSGELTAVGHAAVFQVMFQREHRPIKKNMAIVELQGFENSKPVLNVKQRGLLEEVNPKLVEGAK